MQRLLRRCASACTQRCATGLAALSVLAAAAGTIPTTAVFAVGATVTGGCAVSGNPALTSGLTFGLLDFGVQPAIRTGSLTVAAGTSAGVQALVQCTPGTALQLTVDGGLHASGSQRRLANGGYYLPYALYLTSSGSQPLPPGTAVGLTLGATAAALPIAGTVTFPGSGLAAGTYGDTVQVTLAW